MPTLYEWSGDVYMGGSNSVCVVRVDEDDKSAFLEKGGNARIVLENILQLRRLAVFKRSRAIRSEIRHKEELVNFIDCWWEELIILRAEQGNAVFFIAGDMQADPRKLRTFQSLFWKVFNASPWIHYPE